MAGPLSLSNDQFAALMFDAIKTKARLVLSNHRTDCDVYFEHEAESYNKRAAVYARFNFTNKIFGTLELENRCRWGGLNDATYAQLYEQCVSEAVLHFTKITHWLDRADKVRGRYGRPKQNIRKARKRHIKEAKWEKRI